MTRHLNTKYTLALLSGFIIFGIFLYASYSTYAYEVSNEKRIAQAEIYHVANQFASHINAEMSQVKGLESYILTYPNANLDELNLYATQLYRFKVPYLRSITVLKDTTAFFVYPHTGNEGILGTDLLYVDAQKNSVSYVKSTQHTLTSAPVNLVQGGRGVVVRYPIIHRNSEGISSYYGQISIVLDYDLLKESTGLNRLMETYEIRVESDNLTDQSKQIVYSNTDFISKEASHYSIELPSATWTFYYMPKIGWTGLSSRFWSLLILGSFLSVATAYAFWKQVSISSHLNELVEDRTKALFQTNEYLEQSLGEIEEKQAELYLVNDQLEQSIEELKETQAQLIRSEKFAALGELVAGVAHEINTPLGIGITLATYIADQHNKMKFHFVEGTLSKQQLRDYIENIDESMQAMAGSLSRSAEIISSFKNVAGEQSSLELRQVNLYDYLSDVLQNLKPKIKKTHHTIQLDCPKDLVLFQYPGAFSHILTNLVMNSLIHGFEDTDHGKILIRVSVQEDWGVLIYSDNGKGIAEEHLLQVFDPFFTTKRSQGSTGLGLHIIHNIVTQTLKGRLSLKSGPNEGFHIQIEFPLQVNPHEEDL